MLRLSRNLGQSITLQGEEKENDVFIRVAGINRDSVEIEIDAPAFDIWRTELLRRIEAREREAERLKEKSNGRA
jgi:carbon storage regulator CsrA